MSARLTSVTPSFVEYIPADGENLLPGIVYISMKHGMVVHRCPCGCGQLSEFMLDPIRYRMEYDGEAVSFEPSIGNSNLRCRSHYWIRGNQVRCARLWMIGRQSGLGTGTGQRLEGARGEGDEEQMEDRSVVDAAFELVEGMSGAGCTQGPAHGGNPFTRPTHRCTNSSHLRGKGDDDPPLDELCFGRCNVSKYVDILSPKVCSPLKSCSSSADIPNEKNYRQILYRARTTDVKQSARSI